MMTKVARSKWHKLTVNSDETTRSDGCVEAYPTEGQDLVCGTKLCDNGRRITGRLGMYPLAAEDL